MPPQPNFPIIFRREAWTEHAACRYHPKDWWFPKEGQYESVDARKARSICQTCPVRKECGDYAERNNEMFGIWGGVSSHERNRRRREINQRNRPARPQRKSTRSDASKAIIKQLSDGRWHNYAALVETAAPHIPIERVVGRYNRWARLKQIPQKTGDDPECVAVGLHKVIIDICHNLYQDGIVERSYGTVRLTEAELRHYHRAANNGE